MAPPVSELRSDAQGRALYYLPLISSRAAQKLWGSLASCAPVAYRRSRRVGNPPQGSILPHMKRNIFYFGCGLAALCHGRQYFLAYARRVEGGVMVDFLGTAGAREIVH